MTNQKQQLRREIVEKSTKVVIKAGTRLLNSVEAISTLVEGIAQVRARGKKVLLVSSGAVGMGMRELGLAKRPRELGEVQALAAIGQCRLMQIYSDECRKRGFAAAQLLLTSTDLRNRKSYLNVMNCINALWESGVLPIVNENDPVSIDELKFGDNDTLAGLLASLTDAELTVILTTESGLRERDAEGRLADRISEVKLLTPAMRAMATGTDNAEMSIGGMSSKLRAADVITGSGAALWIADGREEGVLTRVMDGEDIGTLFLPRCGHLPGRKRWISFFARISGHLTVDDGARDAVLRHGKSLLPSGLTGVDGEFQRGATVEVAGRDGRVFARGLVNYSAAECRKVGGLKSNELHRVLSADGDDELIHRDNLTLL